jgi:hypothetical protein
MEVPSRANRDALAPGTTVDGHPCWPTPLEECLLAECFGTAPGQPFTLKTGDLAALGGSSRLLLALLAARRGRAFASQEVSEHAYLARVTNWRRNQRRFLMALGLARDLAAAGVECVFMKGLALTLCHYLDPGLRPMEDVDLLVKPEAIARAVGVLFAAGWKAEDGATAADILRFSRVRHACQFTRGEEESCDLHWHPVVRCYSPLVRQWYWEGAVEARLMGHPVRVPAATDQLFHVCAHGLQWSWTPQIRWVPDSLVILRKPEQVDWPRLGRLAAEGRMNVRLHRALCYLRQRFAVPVPATLLEELEKAPTWRWEEREHELLQKRCPLGMADRVRWHTTQFRRIRRFDEQWRNCNWPGGFVNYLGAFLNRSGAREILGALIRNPESTKQAAGGSE